MNNNKDEGWIVELREEIKSVREWIEKNENNETKNIRLIHLIPILIDAVIDLEKRLHKIERK